jgi:hypothetical protein
VLFKERDNLGRLKDQLVLSPLEKKKVEELKKYESDIISTKEELYTQTTDIMLAMVQLHLELLESQGLIMQLKQEITELKGGDK